MARSGIDVPNYLGKIPVISGISARSHFLVIHLFHMMHHFFVVTLTHVMLHLDLVDLRCASRNGRDACVNGRQSRCRRRNSQSKHQPERGKLHRKCRHVIPFVPSVAKQKCRLKALHPVRIAQRGYRHLIICASRGFGKTGHNVVTLLLSSALLPLPMHRLRRAQPPKKRRKLPRPPRRLVVVISPKRW